MSVSGQQELFFYQSEIPVAHTETGNLPGILGTFDTAGAVKAAEIEADAMFMAKNIDYIYTDDPRKNPNAKKLERVKASEVLAMNLKAIDSTATAFCMSNGMPIHVFGLKNPDDICKALRGETVGTVVTAD